MRGVSSDTVSLWRRTRKSTRDDPSCRLRSITSSRNAGSSRIAQPDFVGERIEFAGREQACSSANGVALAQACGEQATGIERRAMSALALEAAEQFGQAAILHIGARVEQACRKASRAVA